MRTISSSQDVKSYENNLFVHNLFHALPNILIKVLLKHSQLHFHKAFLAYEIHQIWYIYTWVPPWSKIIKDSCECFMFTTPMCNKSTWSMDKNWRWYHRYIKSPSAIITHTHTYMHTFSDACFTTSVNSLESNRPAIIRPAGNSCTILTDFCVALIKYWDREPTNKNSFLPSKVFTNNCLKW